MLIDAAVRMLVLCLLIVPRGIEMLSKLLRMSILRTFNRTKRY